MQTTIIPIPKYMKVCIMDEGNYRHIALITVSFKVFEYIVFYRIQCFFSFRDNQHGFKFSNSTEVCVFSFKNKTIKYQRSTFYFCSFVYANGIALKWMFAEITLQLFRKNKAVS